MAYWNAHESLPEIIAFTDKRKKALATRCKEPLFVENWKRAIDKLSSSAFHAGQNNRKWRADVDWILGNDTNYVRILELAEPEFGSRAVTEEEAEELMAYLHEEELSDPEGAERQRLHAEEKARNIERFRKMRRESKNQDKKEEKTLILSQKCRKESVEVSETDGN